MARTVIFDSRSIQSSQPAAHMAPPVLLMDGFARLRRGTGRQRQIVGGAGHDNHDREGRLRSPFGRPFHRWTLYSSASRSNTPLNASIAA